MGLWFLGIGEKKRGRQPPFLLRIFPLLALLSGPLPVPIENPIESPIESP